MSDATPTSLSIDPAERYLAASRGGRPSDLSWRSEQILAVVVGAHPRAEIADRPLGGWLARTIAERLARRSPVATLQPLVITDLWHLNDRLLMLQPAIALGAPGVNATTAHFAVRLPQHLVIEERLRIHLDPEYPRVRACLWGGDAIATEQAVRLFADRHLDEFLDAAESVAAAAA
jgi:hypothetical protein